MSVRGTKKTPPLALASWLSATLRRHRPLISGTSRALGNFSSCRSAGFASSVASAIGVQHRGTVESWSRVKCCLTVEGDMVLACVTDIGEWGPRDCVQCAAVCTAQEIYDQRGWPDAVHLTGEDLKCWGRWCVHVHTASTTNMR